MTHKTLLGSGIVVFTVYAAVSTAYMVNVGQSSDAVRNFVKRTDGHLNITLLELQGTLRNTSKITPDIRTVRGDARQISNTMMKLDKHVRYLYQYLKNELDAAAGAHSPD